MNDALFQRLELADVHDDLLRNIVSPRARVDLFDDLSADPADWTVANEAEQASQPPAYRAGRTPAIHRPFERAESIDAIRFPFDHWSESRYSRGRFGVWYGSDQLETTLYETVYHWRRFLADAGFHNQAAISERKVYAVRCDAMLIDLRPRIGQFPALIAPDSYTFTQEVGDRFHREGHPGLISHSARCDGDVYALLTPAVLSDPRVHCGLIYRLEPASQEVSVEREAGVEMMRLAIA